MCIESEIESSGNESDWDNEGFELELNNGYNIMIDAASKQNAFKALNNRFYHGNAKSTMRNKRWDWKLAALGFKKITNYFSLYSNNNNSNHNDSYDSSNDNADTIYIQYNSAIL